MTTVEELIQSQEILGEKIVQMNVNYRKDGDQRKTTSYLEKKIASLKTLYSEYVTTDDIIQKIHPPLELSHEYFKGRKIISGTYNALIDELRQRLNKGPPRTPTPSTSANSQASIFFDTNVRDEQNEKTGNTSSFQPTNVNNREEVERKEFHHMIKLQQVKLRSLYREINQAKELLEDKRSKQALKLALRHLERMMEQIMDLDEKINIEALQEDECSLEYFTECIYEKAKREHDEIVVKLATEIEDNRGVNSNHANDIQLPKIEIPTFYGDYMKWKGFADTFEKLIHNSQLTDTHKINYLKSHLGGPASKLISHLESTASNYVIAWDIIKNRYNNERVLATAYFNQLINQTSLGTESAAGIRGIHDTTSEVIHNINNLLTNETKFDALVIHLLHKKLDNETLRIYETTLEDPKKVQSLEHFMGFLEKRFQSLEAMGNNRQNRQPTTNNRYQPSRAITMLATTQQNCINCNLPHTIENCKSFLQLAPIDRITFVNKRNLCRICLKKHNGSWKCTSGTICLVCKGKHHTLLHNKEGATKPPNKNLQPKITTGQLPAKQHITPIVETHMVDNIKPESQVILSTALVKVPTNGNQPELLRLLIDPGSQASFITRDAARKLNIQATKTHVEFRGIGGIKAGVAESMIKFHIEPRFPSKFSMEIKALIVDQLLGKLPENRFNAWKWPHINNLLWADPEFNNPTKIDILLGADYYPGIIMNEIIKGEPGTPAAQKTELGWIIFGPVHYNTPTKVQCLITQTELDNRLKKFWEIEEIQPERVLTEEEQYCQEHYKLNHRRNTNGRYIVRVPFTTNPPVLGCSKTRALARFLHLEKKFTGSPKFADDYKKCIKEYIELGHMKLCDGEVKQSEEYFIPHHAVLKESSTTTKLRVVFDASAKTTNNKSLNEQQLVGPVLQEALISILMRWRKHKIAFTADIEKMYRQILVHEDDQKYQKVLWRENEHEPIQEYQLTTVSFGTASAPYLAIRTLQQLAADEMKEFPIAADIILKDFYVDDVLTGSDSVEQAILQQQQLIELLGKGGFKLQKWASNNCELLKQIPQRSRAVGTMDIKLDESIKALGLSWNPETDTFDFKINTRESKSKAITKRRLVSEVSQLFDPLGWLSPAIIIAKILLQKLWLIGVSWDEPLPNNIVRKWNDYKNNLPALEQLKIPRWVETINNSPIELHGFCDASEQAYAAVVYCCQRDEIHGMARPYLLISKTKVAPIKSQLTIPRLELCGALLLARLMAKVIKSIQIPKITTYAWTDSQIVLAWIKAEPHRFKTFVANRVSEIHSLTNPSTWNYIKSGENPADCASRGVEPENLAKLQLWWNGPEWLGKIPREWPIHNSADKIENVPEQKLIAVTKTAIITNDYSPFDQLYAKFSNLKKIQRIVSYCRRFINKLKSIEFASENISQEEMEGAMHYLIVNAQQSQYSNEIENLKNNKPINNKSKLLPLSPFLNNDVLRVSGRLHNSTTWSYDEKHPIILPQSHPIVNLIIQDGHRSTMHGGTQLTLAYIRTKYWIVNGRNLVRRQIAKCLRCHRFSKTIKNQLMGNLPEARLTPARPFLKSGVDYAGPLSVRVSKGRGTKSYKGYLAIFVCMTTKAVHIEVVSDLTTEAFMAAYKRFISRRGICSDIFCDNGTNFVGASKIMDQEAVKLMTSNITNYTAENGTKWHFIPPGAPHFGGLWEAAVKSVKYHLKRVVGETTLTFEELTTLTCQIEACLNSRPISPMTNDPSDPTFLTPGHFLIGEPLLSQPETSVAEKKINSLSRWKLIQRMKEDFWKKWSQEYLHQLQQRAKWAKGTTNVKIGQLVLVRDTNIPPTKWIIGRIVEVHPGKDGVVRVATLRGPGRALIKRPVAKLSPLPLENNCEEEQIKAAIQPTTVLFATRRQCINDEGPKIEEADTEKLKVSPPAKEKRKIRAHHQSKLMLYTILPLASLLAICTAQVKAPSYDINTLNATSGIYFEHIGSAQLSHQQWTLVSYFNLSTIFLEVGMYTAALERMNETCRHDNGWIQLRQLCRIALPQMKQQLHNININNEIFQPTYYHARTKRGLVNIVGTLTNQLFGILDQDDAQRYNKEITTLKDNNQHMYQLLKEQITITESTVNIIKKDWIAVNQELQEMDKQTLAMMNLIQVIQNEKEAAQRFMALWMQLAMEMAIFYSMQQQLIDVITDIHHSKINTLILKPDQLRTEIQKLHKIIPADATIYGESNMLTLYQMMTAKVGRTNDLLIFELKLPLFNNKIYQIIKPIAIPTKHEDLYAYIQPSSQLILISLNRESYYPMSEEELKSCKTIKPLEHLCIIHNVIYNTQNKQGSCELNLFMNDDTSLNSCQVRFMKPTNMWIPTHDPSTWIFVSEKDHSVNIICNKEVTTTNIRGTGIIIMHKACTITDGITTIHSIETFNTRMESFYQPTINLNNLLNQSKSEDNNNITNKIVMHTELNNILSNLSQLSSNITHLKDSMQEGDQQMNYHDVHHYIAVYGTIVVFIVIITAYHYKTKPTTPTITSSRPTPLSRRFISTIGAPEDVQIHEHKDHKDRSNNVV